MKNEQRECGKVVLRIKNKSETTKTHENVTIWERERMIRKERRRERSWGKY